MAESTTRGSVAGGPSGIALSHGLAPRPIRFPSPRVRSLSLEPESLPTNATTGIRSHSRQPNVNIISSSPAESTLSSTSTISDSTAIPGSPAFSTRTLRPKPRPSLPRPDSTIYDSLPFDAPSTPWSEENSHSQDGGWLAFFGLSSLSSQSRTTEEGRNGNGIGRSDLERQALLGPGRSTESDDSRQRRESDYARARRDSDIELFAGRKEGLPKLSRECLISEIKCYGKHMLPPILFFVVFVLGFGLWLYNKQRGGD